MKKILVLLVAITLLCSALGCAKIGEATGKTVKEIKELPGEFKDGYDKGRNSEDDGKK
ncbi:hypothetical protein [Pseudodesulfovibrio sediminis]|uniref:Lipoprotein n=1 Tax=Pseudodesulfovibrio sediminis TaxID=2810563 RepID=A0ABN6ETF6_9BACT|nr:hypothetical protein [Pseudodesulfovibrio sediminis]BCS88454.1 hypothetical protein PSDVSF_16960 [Pseudodesulfovibrio sediminis]